MCYVIKVCIHFTMVQYVLICTLYNVTAVPRHLFNQSQCPLPFSAPFYHRVVQRTDVKFLFWSLQRLVSFFMQQQKHSHAKSHTTSNCKHTKYNHETYNPVRCRDFSSKTKRMHHSINLSITGNARLNRAPASRKLPEDINKKGQMASTDTAAVYGEKKL